MRNLLKRHRLLAFFVAAYLLSWYPWFFALARGTTTGPNPLGPLIAAILVTALADGKAGLRAFLSRLVRWRVGIHWYALVLLLPFVVCAVAAVMAVTFGAAPKPFVVPNWREVLGRFIFIFLFIGLGEEPGWRGFALPHLQTRHSAVVASLILAPLWALWHLPLMGNEFAPNVIPAFVVSVFGGTFFQTWLFNRTRGSVLPQMLLHSMVNTVGAGTLFPLFKESGLIALWWSYAFIWLLLGLAALLIDRRAERET